MLTCVASTSLAQVLLKIGTSQASARALATGQQGIGQVLNMLSTPLVMLGLAVYVGSAIIYLKVLSEVPLSQAYPMVALSYALTMLAGVLWLNEPLVASRVAGAALVLIGVALIAWR